MKLEIVVKDASLVLTDDNGAPILSLTEGHYALSLDSATAIPALTKLRAQIVEMLDVNK